MKVLVGAFNKEKAPEGEFSGHCGSFARVRCQLYQQRGHLSSCATQEPSREMAHTPRLQPGSCHVAPPARNPELVWHPDLELDRGDCLSELGRGGCLLELQTKVREDFTISQDKGHDRLSVMIFASTHLGVNTCLAKCLKLIDS